MMTKLYRYLGLMALSVGAIGSAHAVTINDDYWGADHHNWGDRIGGSVYEVNSLDVEFVGDYLSVRVNTNFSEAGDPYGIIDYGDLFISTDGWNPYGSAPYAGDNAATGEDWEFVFDTSAASLYGGAFSIANSEDLMPSGYVYRNGQEVQRAGGGVALAGSSVDLSQAGTGGYITYNILLDSLNLSGSGELGLKWGMTCANDTIEGAVAYRVPEPGSLGLLGLGLLGLGLGARRKSRRV